MPDATITSTASTFGTITGTFAADQSTVTGTITAITGTVDGSVGVPGPAGPAGAAGQGVPVGGTAGQVLQKLSATSYDTGWLTLPADYITSVTAPLAVASGNLSVNLSAYLPLAGGYITGDIQSSNNSAYRSWDGAYNTSVLKADYLQMGNSNIGGNTLTVEWDGITFADGKQTVKYPGASILTGYALESWVTAGFYPLSGNPSGFIDASALTGYATETFVTTQGYITQATADGLYYPLTGNPSGFLTSVPPPTLTNLTSDISWDISFSSGRLLISGVNDIGGGFTEARLNFTSAVPTQPATGDFWTNGTDFFYASGGVKTIASQSYVSATYQTLAGMSSYLTTATAASTYAVIAAGQPTAGTTGQVLTKNSGTNYDSSWATLIPGDRYLTTSTTSNTVSNGNKTFTIGTGLSYTPTQNITISYDASNHMHGEVLTYNSGTGVLTVDINHHTGSGTYAAWVVNVGGVTPATSVAWGGITGTLSAQTDLQSALDLKANLASPTFTGTPTLPTGTIATTQSPGNNTTALATTAFVTAAVPAFATETQAIYGTSSTTALSPLLMRYILANPMLTTYNSLVGNYSSFVSGSGAISAVWSNLFGVQITAANGKAAFQPNSQVSYHSIQSRGKPELTVDWTKPMWFSFRFCYSSAAQIGNSNTVNRVTIGKVSSTFGNLTTRGFGVTWTAGTTGAFTVSAHNGTALSSSASAVTVSNATYFPSTSSAADFMVYSDGAGNVTLYCNNEQVATTTGGPSSGTSPGPRFMFETDNTTSTSGTVTCDYTGVKSMLAY